MAEFVMRKLADDAGLSEQIKTASAATSGEEIGNPVYLPVRKLLSNHSIDCTGKTARRLTKRDYAEYDYIIGMDSANMRDMRRIFEIDENIENADLCGAARDKLCLLRDFTDRPGDIVDPWYTRDFAATWRDVNEGCAGLIEKIKAEI